MMAWLGGFFFRSVVRCTYLYIDVYPGIYRNPKTREVRRLIIVTGAMAEKFSS